ANNNPYKFVDPDGRCTGTRIKNVCESGGPAGLHRSAREGIAGKATYEANKALHKAGAFRPYERRAEMHRAFADAVEPVATRHGVEIAALTYRGRSGLWALGRAFSSGHSTTVVGLFDGHKYSQLQLMGYIHTHPNRTMFSGEGLSYAWGASDYKCSSASLDCSIGDISA